MSESTDAQWSQTASLLRYQQGSKSVGVSFFLWLFLGAFGTHRFYNARIVSGVALLALTVLGIALSPFGIGFPFLAMSGLWLIMDAFRIMRWVDDHNADLIHSIRHGDRAPRRAPLIKGSPRQTSGERSGFRPPIV